VSAPATPFRRIRGLGAFLAAEPGDHAADLRLGGAARPTTVFFDVAGASSAMRAPPSLLEEHDPGRAEHERGVHVLMVEKKGVFQGEECRVWWRAIISVLCSVQARAVGGARAPAGQRITPALDHAAPCRAAVRFDHPSRARDVRGDTQHLHASRRARQGLGF